MGWLWQVNRGGGSTNTPTASATVANLKQDRIRPQKSLGQNFLTDDSILERIVLAAGVKSGDQVLEIGPGTGNLTKHLVGLGAKVTALEKDDTLFERLKETYEGVENLRLVKGDVLRVNLDEILDELASQGGGRKIRVLSNLPYNITKEFLKLMLPKSDRVSELSIMIQEEVAQRLVDRRPARSDYRAMNIRVLFYSKPKYQFLIPKEKYYPAPNVDGALVSFVLTPVEKRLKVVSSERGFMSFVSKAFSERRKMMRNSVQPLYSQGQVEEALEGCGLRKDARAQDLTVEEFVRVYNRLGEALVQVLDVEEEE